jgi:hypothetical protein
MARKAKLGSGKRFSNLKRSLTRKGVRNPGALAASIGRKKYGKKRFQKLATTGRKRSARSKSSSKKK